MAGTYHLLGLETHCKDRAHSIRTVRGRKMSTFCASVTLLVELQRLKAQSASYINLTPHDGGNISLAWLGNSLQRQGTLHQNRERTENVNFSCKCDTIGRVA